MTEFWLFIIAAAIAVLFAVLMLLNENAVHSALSLIVTMVSISFLFLLLDAPFLAMIQITVYAGAIMVLFLFVIMLLGAEKSESPDMPGPGTTKFRWFTGAAVGLTFALLASIGLSIINSQVDSREIPIADPQVRVGHFAPDVGAVDVYAGETQVADDLLFGETTSFVSLPAGENTLRVVPVDGGAELSTTVTLEGGSVQTVLAYGVDAVEFAVIPQDFSTVTEDRTSRVMVFNANPNVTVRMVDMGSELVADDTRDLIAGVPYGQVSDVTLLEEDTVQWTFVDDAQPDNILYRLRDYELERDTMQLVVFTPEREFDGSLRDNVYPLASETAPSFGGPRAIGYALFTTYMLPFQLLALLLLAAMVGVIVLTHRETEKVGAKVGGRRRVSRPLVNVIAAQTGTDVTEDGAPEGSPTAGD